MPNNKLATYRQKRDFRFTPEPRHVAAQPGRGLRFVVQKHAARRLHYDFRLELDGVLKSWAVPKGPSLDPADKRLAVHVEDHPLAYADFEGTIPPKQYGAGEVIIWDRGEWLPDGDPSSAYRAGKIKFHLRGHKLNGAWALVRTRLTGSGGKEQWLLIKERDDTARAADEFNIVEALPESVARKQSAAENKSIKPATRVWPKKKVFASLDPALLSGAVKANLPQKLNPQLATLVDKIPAQGEWQYELKFDGYRLLTRIADKKTRLFTRSGKDWSEKLPHLVQAIQALGVLDAWIDGEIVVLDANGAPDFQKLQNAFDNGRTEKIQYFVFDLPYFNGYDLRRTPLNERRELLQRLCAQQAALHFSEDFAETPQQILANACQLSLEGIIGKRRDAEYMSGRSNSWIKLKCQQRQEFIIGGFTEPQGSRTGFGALLLGVYDDAGQLRYAGKVGTGFNNQRLASMHARLKALATSHAAFAHPPRERGIHWVEPKLVAEISFAQWTHDGLIRQGVFHGIRADKPAQEIKRERPSAITDADAPRTTRLKYKSKSSADEDDSVAGVKISHAQRVIDKRTGLTKIDLARYYETVAPWMLPHLAARPVALVRAPDGVDGEHFFQKHAQHLSIADVRILDKRFDPGHAPLMVIDSVTALVSAVQMGAIEFHTWNATTSSIEHPERFILDLDPDVSLPWQQMVEAAQLTKAALDELGLNSFLKTSGGKGLHIIVPLLRRYTWEQVQDFSQAIARHLSKTIPQRFSAKMGAQNRIDKVFVDYLRNRRGASTVAAFSARARSGLAVSAPISWEELGQIEGSDQWNIQTLPARLRELRNDVWKNYTHANQRITNDMKRALGLAISHD
ncbi:MAG: DNA ligase D [Gammaproteobacteria bacterium]|nr:DNA ligase D [Gammaproteobacteria bacterium]